ncbi:MAG: hypothetical protein JO235_20725 [Chroococcidiopsidaceae cyanobacterium CP_BM_RX_35]|nr:hypothetical protein [Chroococcidiopsidaceae cyanobacterium CP_BM_RX_35]
MIVTITGVKVPKGLLMQLLALNETNLFNTLTDQEQGVVVGGNGGKVYFAGATPNGGFYAFSNSGNYSSSGAVSAGYYSYTSPQGKTYKFSWGKS